MTWIGGGLGLFSVVKKERKKRKEDHSGVNEKIPVTRYRTFATRSRARHRVIGGSRGHWTKRDGFTVAVGPRRALVTPPPRRTGAPAASDPPPRQFSGPREVWRCLQTSVRTALTSKRAITCGTDELRRRRRRSGYEI